MKIGIDGSRAFIEKRTGIEEYSYQVIKHLRQQLKEGDVFLYMKNGQEVDFELPENWKIRKLWFPRFWTQIRLSLAVFFDSIDILFIPAHTVPILHPKKTIVVIHGLEYEFCPEAYSWAERKYMRFVIRNSCKWASKIVCVSENTRTDLIELYGVSAEKVSVIYEGYEENSDEEEDRGLLGNAEISSISESKKYILFIGRIEKRKNVEGILSAFELVKEKYGIEHKLVLVGKPGFGYDDIVSKIESSKFEKDIIQLGYISKKEKAVILKGAAVFVFPSFYEGFGLPILEAQNAFVPVVTSEISSIPEVAGNSVLYCNPNDHASLAENIYLLLKSEEIRNDIARKGHENLKRFSWSKCAEELGNIIKKQF